MIERRRYSEHPPRYEYLLTEAGRELQPILLALKEWGDRHCNPGAEPVVFQHTCGADFTPDRLRRLREPLRDGELTVRPAAPIPSKQPCNNGYDGYSSPQGEDGSPR